jgi:hypothetical protein
MLIACFGNYFHRELAALGHAALFVAWFGSWFGSWFDAAGLFVFVGVVAG